MRIRRIDFANYSYWILPAAVLGLLFWVGAVFLVIGG